MSIRPAVCLCDKKVPRQELDVLPADKILISVETDWSSFSWLALISLGTREGQALSRELIIILRILYAAGELSGWSEDDDGGHRV